MVVSKHFTHFYNQMRLVLHQYLISHVTNSGIPPEVHTPQEGNVSTRHQTRFLDYSDQNHNKISSPEREFLTSITLKNEAKAPLPRGGPV